MRTYSERYQVVFLENGIETDHWTHYKNVAVSVAKDIRKRHPNADVVAVYDHDPVPTYF